MNLPDIERYIGMRIPVQAIEPAWLASPPPRAVAHHEHADFEAPTCEAAAADDAKVAAGKRRRRRRKPQNRTAAPHS
jgi:hypothetical protein